jgi:starch synthase
MHRLGFLNRLYTGYPRWKVASPPRQFVETFPWLWTSIAGAQRIGLQVSSPSINRLKIKTFDSWLARRIAPCEVFHSLSSFGTATHMVAKQRYGAVTICDRGSSHIQHQEAVLRDEFDRRGVVWSGIDPWIIDRENQEYESCDLIFVPSNYARRTFLQRGVADKKLRVNPFGVDLQFFRKIPKRDDVFRVLYVGALSFRKGVAYLLEAIDAINLPKFEVWLIGALTPDLAPLVRKYTSKIRCFGTIPRRELFKYYSQASVLALPSLEEGLALVQAQAMACGVPIIATANAGAEDLFADGIEGFIVASHSSEVIREKIEFLYSNPDTRDAMGDAALRRVQSIGGWKSYGERSLGLYRSALCRVAAESAIDDDKMPGASVAK